MNTLLKKLTKKYGVKADTVHVEKHMSDLVDDAREALESLKRYFADKNNEAALFKMFGADWKEDGESIDECLNSKILWRVKI